MQLRRVLLGSWERSGARVWAECKLASRVFLVKYTISVIVVQSSPECCRSTCGPHSDVENAAGVRAPPAAEPLAAGPAGAPYQARDPVVAVARRCPAGCADVVGGSEGALRAKGNGPYRVCLAGRSQWPNECSQRGCLAWPYSTRCRAAGPFCLCVRGTPTPLLEQRCVLPVAKCSHPRHTLDQGIPCSG